MELNDGIRNRHFGCVLDSHFWKTSNEYTALACLKYCFGEKYRYLRKAEAPDLQDAENSVAIEVTDSVTPNDAQIIGEFTKLSQVNSEKQKEKCRKKIIQNGARLLSDGMIAGKSRGPETERHEIINAFVQKLSKISKYRKMGFANIGLLIYHEKPAFPETIDNFPEWLIDAQKDCADKYDFVYILHVEGLLFYDFANREKSEIIIPHEDRLALGKLGRMAAEGEVKDDDPIWL